MYPGIFYHIMGALRFLVIEDDKRKEYRCMFKSFNDVKRFYDSITGDDNHWENLYHKAVLHYLTEFEKIMFCGSPGMRFRAS